MVGIAALLCYAMLKLFWFEQREFVLTEHYWDYEWQVENYAPRTYTIWGDEENVPATAYNISVSREYSPTRRSGVDCTSRSGKNNGYTCDRVTYTNNEWGYEFSTHVTGDSLEDDRTFDEPEELNLCEIPEIGRNCQKKSNQIEHYSITLYRMDTKTNYSCTVPLSVWGNKEQSVFKANVNMVDQWADCNSLQLVVGK